MSHRVERLRDALLVQCTPADTFPALELAARPGVGVVLTKPRRKELWALAEVAGRRPLLADADCYSGAKRRRAVEPFDQAWLAAQRSAGLPVLSDSGYIGQRDDAGLDNVLRQAASEDDVIATLPLHPWWLDPAGGLPRLLDRVNAAGVPVAVVLEHRDDPLGVKRTLHGMLALLTAEVPVIQLRCDVSGLGLVCHGAHAAAVGTRSRLRHLYPVVTKSGRPRPPSVATVARECLSFVAVDKIALAVQADPDNPLWAACTCQACQGRQLDFIALLDRTTQQRAAFGHALHTLFELRDQLLTGASGPAERQVRWREHCTAALVHYDKLHAAGQNWKVPAFLRHWSGIPVPTRTST